MLGERILRNSTAPITGVEYVDIEEWKKKADTRIEKRIANVEAYKREGTIGGECSRYMPMAWSDFTGWHRHLG